MRALTVAGVMVVLGVSGTAGMGARGQVPVGSPVTAACGADAGKFELKRDKVRPPAPIAAANKAVVYLVQEIQDINLVSKTINVGVDGQWKGAMGRMTYMTMVMDPGIHHLCVKYNGKAAVGYEGSIILRRLNVEGGKTYYLRYRGYFVSGPGLVSFLDEVDEDEGQRLVQETDHVTSTPKT